MSDEVHQIIIELTDIGDVAMRPVGAVPSQIRNEGTDARPLQSQRQRMHIHTATRRPVQQYGNLRAGCSVLAIGQARAIARFVTEDLRQGPGING